jgi:hypothetical protein
MGDDVVWETYSANSATLEARISDYLEQGRLRRIVIDCNGKTIAEFPIAAGLADLVGPPIKHAVAALAGRLCDCLVHLQIAEKDDRGWARVPDTGRAPAF